MKKILSIKDIFGPAGILAQILPGFKHRPGQQNMAEAVLRSLVNGGKLLVEAGTGTGKTLAYLIPAVLSESKILISTGTKNLQDQIISKEIPFLQKYLFPGMNAICMKGRRNYLCLNKWKRFHIQTRIDFPNREEIHARLADWLQQTTYADCAELDWLPEDHPVWNEFSCSPEQCLGSVCPEEKNCYIGLVRSDAARANIVVVNHHLFFSDIVVRNSGYGEVIPRYEAVIFDEAHHLEDVATSYFGYSISNYRFLDLLNDAEREVTLSLLQPGQKMESLKQLSIIRSLVDSFFNLLNFAEGRTRIRSPLYLDPLVNTLKENLLKSLFEAGASMENFAGRSEIFAPVARRFFELAKKFALLTEAGEDDMIYWAEKRQRFTALSASPLDVSTDLKDKVYENLKSAVFASATLTVQRKFGFFESRLGLDSDTERLVFDSPFDYAANALLYIPQDIPEPNTSTFCEAAASEIGAILEASSGRALVLFTSYRNMEEVFEIVQNRISFPLFMQGQKSRSALLDCFRTETSSVLFATSSFWEGIDVPGESLSCVIIDKLPFGVPSDPVLESRLEWLARQGKNPFLDYQLPLAVLSLRQGFGRLIRSETDRGLMAILDSRILKRPYGRSFLQSLPQMPMTQELADVKKFFLPQPVTPGKEVQS